MHKGINSYSSIGLVLGLDPSRASIWISIYVLALQPNREPVCPRPTPWIDISSIHRIPFFPFVCALLRLCYCAAFFGFGCGEGAYNVRRQRNPTSTLEGRSVHACHAGFQKSLIRAPIHFKADLVGLRRGGFVWDSCDDMKFWMSFLW